MSFLTRATDTIMTFRFLRLLTTPWEKMGAYELGIIDKDGKFLRPAANAEERSKYNIFHKLVFNLKRLLNKIPFGKTTLASYIAALYLIKEHTKMSDRALTEIMSDVTGQNFGKTLLAEECKWFIDESTGLIRPGVYSLLEDTPLAIGDFVAKKGTAVIVKESTPIGSVMGVNVYSALHKKTNQKIYISTLNIQ